MTRLSKLYHLIYSTFGLILDPKDFWPQHIPPGQYSSKLNRSHSAATKHVRSTPEPYTMIDSQFYGGENIHTDVDSHRWEHLYELGEKYLKSLLFKLFLRWNIGISRCDTSYFYIFFWRILHRSVVKVSFLDIIYYEIRFKQIIMSIYIYLYLWW